MTKTDIEWCDYSINPVKGLCPVACDYCYARRMYKRFKWNPEIRFEPIRDTDLPKKPSRIFVGSTIELFAEWVDAFWLDSIFKTVKDNPQHTFIFLTKRPGNLPKVFPDNCWIGVSVTSHSELADKWELMRNIQAKVKFVSFEPLINWADDAHNRIYQEGIINSGIQWLILGQLTPASPKTSPQIEWVKEIVEACDMAGVPVFLKNNLRDLLCPGALMDDIFWVDERAKLRQELP